MNANKKTAPILFTVQYKF